MDRLKATALVRKIEGILRAALPGLEVCLERAMFTDTGVKATLTVEGPDQDGIVEPVEVRAFKRLAHRYGLLASDLNTGFVQHGVTYRIVGLEPRNHRYPVLVVAVSTGRRHKLTASSVLHGIGRPVPPGVV